MSRKEAYGQMQQVLKIDADKCHIGFFTVEQCRQVVDHFKPITDALLEGELEIER